MSEENVEVIRRLYRAMDARDTEAFTELLDEDVRWHPPEDVPEHASLAGREAILRYVSGYVDAFDDFDVEAEEVTESGDSVIVSVRLSGRMKGSAAPVELTGAQVFAFNERGLVTRVREFRSQGRSPRSRRAAGVGQDSSDL